MSLPGKKIIYYFFFAGFSFAILAALREKSRLKVKVKKG
jgi:hypothetical protein